MSWEQDFGTLRQYCCPGPHLVLCGTKIRSKPLPWKQKKTFSDDPVPMTRNLVEMATLLTKMPILATDADSVPLSATYNETLY